MRRAFRMLFCVAAGAATGVFAAEQGIQLKRDDFAGWTQPPRFDSLFWRRFENAFEERANDQFADRFHSFSIMKRTLTSGGNDSYALRERSTRSAPLALAHSIALALRDATMEHPFLEWLEQRQGLLTDFVRGTLESFGETSVSPLDPSYGFVERSWWKRLSESGRMYCGIRPFRTDPYAFLSLRLKDGDTLLALMHLRYHYQQFADHSFEVALSVPIVDGLSLDVGGTYQFGRHDETRKIAFKLFKEFKNGAFLQAGLKAQDQPEIFAGACLLF